MKSPKFAGRCLAGLLALSLCCIAPLPSGAAIPHFLLMRDSTCQFFDQRDFDQNVRETLRVPSVSDEGLYSGALARDFILGQPYSLKAPNYFEMGWTLPLAVAYIDQYGLFDLAPVAEDKALSMSKRPLGELGDDGLLGLLDAAHYFSSTGRAGTADKIFTNLRSNLFPKMAPKGLSGTVLYAYVDYAREKGDNEGAEAATRAVERLESSANGSLNINRYEGFNHVACDTDWKPAAAAYQAINSAKFAEADKIIAGLIADEKKLDTHKQTSLARLIQLSKLYARKGKIAEAQSLLEQLLPLTSAGEMANTRLYVSAELFTLPGCEKNKKYRDQLFENAKHVDELISSISLIPEGTADERAQRIVRYLDNLALAYSYNDEPQKAHAVLEAALAYHAPATDSKYLVDAHRAFFAVCVGEYSVVPTYVEADIRDIPPQMQGPFVDILAKIMYVCMKQGRSDVAEKFALHIIDVRTKKMATLPMRPNESNQTPAQLKENRRCELEFELSAVRYKLGGIYLAKKRFAEAEAALNLVAEYGGELVGQQMQQRNIDLAKALSGQKKYSEAVDVFAKWGSDGRENSLPLNWAIIDFMSNRPILTEVEQTKLGGAFRETYRSCNGKGLLEPTRRFLALCKEQKWPESEINSLMEHEKACLEDTQR